MISARIVQLPFPSTGAPSEKLVKYYRHYERVFSEELPQYYIPDNELWEAPLWVSHLTALLDKVGLDSSFSDLSKAAIDVDACANVLVDTSEPGDLVLFSPLAQNFDLTLAVSQILMAAGRRTALGGNMAGLADAESATHVHRGQLTADALRRLLAPGTASSVTELPLVSGRAGQDISWSPDHRHLEKYRGRVPMLRLNASHGCLYTCSFCGDAWSSQLTLVQRHALEQELDDLVERFPETRLIYIGDKTFGQSRQSVANLIDVFAERPGFTFIAQSHVMALKPWVLDALDELGVRILEMGFESADTSMLSDGGKLSKGLPHYEDQLATLRDRGIRTVLNVMGGLPWETRESHEKTASWLRQNPAGVWLANLYNFVPYPLTPVFDSLRQRVVDWNFAAWREDAPVVYTPYHLSIEDSWELFLDKVDAATTMITAGATR
jgi:uncharacterized radical SAM superfamily protein